MSQEEDMQQEEEKACPEMIVDYEGECHSLTERSVLTFQAGRNPEGNVPVLRIARNSGGGMYAKDWAPVEHIDAILEKADPLTGRAFNDVHPGKSINTGSFILAILKDLGVVQAKDDNTRHHERVPGMTVLKALAARIAESQNATPAKGRRTSKAE
jgi:hypothetical protein